MADLDLHSTISLGVSFAPRFDQMPGTFDSVDGTFDSPSGFEAVVVEVGEATNLSSSLGLAVFGDVGISGTAYVAREVMLNLMEGSVPSNLVYSALSLDAGLVVDISGLGAMAIDRAVEMTITPSITNTASVAVKAEILASFGADLAYGGPRFDGKSIECEIHVKLGETVLAQYVQTPIVWYTDVLDPSASLYKDVTYD